MTPPVLYCTACRTYRDANGFRWVRGELVCGECAPTLEIAAVIRDGEALPIGDRRTVDVAREANANGSSHE